VNGAGHHWLRQPAADAAVGLCLMPPEEQELDPLTALDSVNQIGD
jgi:hypothetical protein